MAAADEVRLSSLVRKRHAEPRADRRRDEIDLGKALAAEQPVGADPRAAGDADRRQEEIGNAQMPLRILAQASHWSPAPLRATEGRRVEIEEPGSRCNPTPLRSAMGAPCT